MYAPEDFHPAVYSGKDPFGHDGLWLMLPKKNMPHEMIPIVLEMMDAITEVGRQYGYKYQWKEYLSLEVGKQHAIRERAERESPRSKPADEGDGGIPLAQLGPEESPPQGPVV